MSLQFVNFGTRPAKTDTFDCGVESLNHFVRERAEVFVKKGLCAVTFLMDTDHDGVYGIHTISPFSVDSEVLREEQRKYYNVTFPIPAWKIGVLAVEKNINEMLRRA